MSGPNPLGVPGRRVGQAFQGQLVSGSFPFGVPGRRVDREFLGQLVSGTFPFGALGSGRLARGARPGPKVPTDYHHFLVLFPILPNIK